MGGSGSVLHEPESIAAVHADSVFTDRRPRERRTLLHVALYGEAEQGVLEVIFLLGIQDRRSEISQLLQG